jgi:hypothetical protein
LSSTSDNGYLNWVFELEIDRGSVLYLHKLLNYQLNRYYKAIDKSVKHFILWTSILK